MDKTEIFNRIEYVVACVGAFAQRYDLSNMQAYAYLRRFTNQNKQTMLTRNALNLKPNCCIGASNERLQTTTPQARTIR